MRRWLMGAALGAALSSLVYAATEREKLQEITVNTVNDAPFIIPPEYGRLVSVVAKSEVQYLYFEASDGTVRIMLVGSRGAIQRASSELQLLTPEVYVMKRADSIPPPAPTESRRWP
ncbi:MAG: hypothetical protein HY737_00200 [Candidatus Omnitrophica bacterium]|nr:hypothetical protein [Candidatus Omnitrophota bacterium]